MPRPINQYKFLAIQYIRSKSKRNDIPPPIVWKRWGADFYTKMPPFDGYASMEDLEHVNDRFPHCLLNWLDQRCT
jgi:hypothetical protein